jgi:hypothetical protein
VLQREEAYRFQPPPSEHDGDSDSFTHILEDDVSVDWSEVEQGQPDQQANLEIDIFGLYSSQLSDDLAHQLRHLIRSLHLGVALGLPKLVSSFRIWLSSTSCRSVQSFAIPCRAS